MSKIRFDAPPTVAAFMRSTAFFRIVAGPVGSGKTTGCIFEVLRRAIEQRPAPDGVRYTRFAIVRKTLKQLEDTVLKDIRQWLAGIHEYRAQAKTVVIKMQLADGTRVASEWILIPLEDAEDQSRLLSSQLTGAWMSEAIDISTDLVQAITGRCGRYPSGAQGGCTWYGIIADTNMPSRGSDWHRLMALETPTNCEVFIQPGGMDDDAENLEWLLQTEETLKLPVNDERRRAQGRTYYINAMSAGQGKDWCDRYIHAKYGADPSGQTVFVNSFDGDRHVVSSLQPVRGRTLIIGQDFGRNPCAVICQQDGRDRLLVLEELISVNMGLEQHVKDSLRPALLSPRFAGLPFYIIGDPSGVAGGQVFDESPFDYLNKENYRAYPAPSNAIDKRLAAVESHFLHNVGEDPGILIDEQGCPTLVRALSIEYRYAKRRNGNLAPLPEKKNPWSDVVDALQYVCLATNSGLGEYLTTQLFANRKASGAVRRRMPVGAWT
ncbi:terminase [Methylobacterium sp. GXF4]|uniref:hypothetical protein n=1 Tax=Methylobacterium sp. GXF4 TaxID=1096546 RepID=UPI0002698F63|nr:hypothetical protein [Methylobacterium sp. GXF4]EIZ87166.1 terminase [Methylobacterium sp. GXF4]